MFGFKKTEKKNEIVKAMTHIEIQPYTTKSKADLIEYTKISLSEIGALGLSFQAIMQSLQNISTAHGGSGLYKVSVPNNMHLQALKNGNFFGTAVENGNTKFAKQAELTPVSHINPTTLYTAVVLMSINKKLESVEETGKQIIAFLEEKERAKLEGNLEILTDIFNNYKFNIENALYKTNKHIQVQAIKQEAENSIKLYRTQIEKEIKKNSGLHGDHNVEEKINKIEKYYKNYQLALYLYCFAYFLEIMLFENFEKAYLESVSKTIEKHCVEYTSLYNKSCEMIDEYSKTSMQTYTSKALSGLSKGTGKLIAKIPLINKTQLDENLISAGERLKETRTEQTSCVMEKAFAGDTEFVTPFIENIHRVNTLYNEPIEMLFDNETMYIKGN